MLLKHDITYINSILTIIMNMDYIINISFIMKAELYNGNS
jgi:hypothetical protein